MSRLLDLLWRAGWIVLFQLHLLPSVKRASEETRARRLATCRACPIFTPRFSRCGPKLATDPETEQVVTLGCSCILPVKVKILDARCWAREQGLQMGWPDEINGRDTK